MRVPKVKETPIYMHSLDTSIAPTIYAPTITPIIRSKPQVLTILQGP